MPVWTRPAASATSGPTISGKRLPSVIPRMAAVFAATPAGRAPSITRTHFCPLLNIPAHLLSLDSVPRGPAPPSVSRTPPGRKGGDPFPQDDHRGRDGDDRHAVDVDARLDRAEPPDREVPGDEAEGGGPQPEVEDVEKEHGIRKAREAPVEIGEQQGGEHEEQPVEENAAGGLDGGAAERGNAAGEDRVDRPHEGREQGEQIAEGVEAQDGGPIKADERDARERDGQSR